MTTGAEPAPQGACATCRYWREGADIFGWVELPAGWKMCLRTLNPLSTVSETEDADSAEGLLAIAYDAEQYRACLGTAPDFGCRMWKATPA